MSSQRNGGKWTEGRWNSFVTSTLRAGSRKYPPKFETLNEAKTEKRINPKSGRLAQHYLCASCGDEYVAKEVQVDHIVPIGTEKTWDEFVEGLFCEKDNLQVLCLVCHKKKTLAEKPKKEKK